MNKTNSQQLTFEEAFADIAYSGKDNLSFLHIEEIFPSISLNPAEYGTREEDLFNYDKENDEVKSTAGLPSMTKAKTGRTSTNKNSCLTFVNNDH